MRDALILFLLEGILGYLMQHFAFIVGMHGIARHRANWLRVSISSAICAVLLALLRRIPMLQFGVHTMLNCLLTNAACIIICRMDVRKSVLGSVIMMILILLSDLVNFGVCAMCMDISQITPFLQDPINKAFSALPGNFTVLICALLIYKIRIKKAETVK